MSLYIDAMLHQGNRERQIIAMLYRTQGLPDPDWPPLEQACRKALLAGIYAACGRRGGLPVDLLEDLMQDTRLRLYPQEYRVLRQVQGPMPAALLGLLKTMAANTTYDYFRYRQSLKRDIRREVALERCTALGGEDRAPERIMMLRAVEQALPRILPADRLQRDRRIFWLYHRHCYSAREIAALPGVCLSTKGVESALKRMLDGLRRQLGT